MTASSPDRLRELAFFQNLPDSAVEHFAARAEEREHEPGDLVLRQHDEVRTVILLVSGTLQVLVRFEGAGDLLMGILRDPGTLEGWSAFRAPYRATASLRCEEPTTLLEIPREAFEEAFAQLTDGESRTD